MNLADFAHRGITGAMAASVSAAVGAIVETAPCHGWPQLSLEFGIGDMFWAVTGPAVAMALFLLARECIFSPSERFREDAQMSAAIVAVIVGLAILGVSAFACYARAGVSFAKDTNMVQVVGPHYPGWNWDATARWALMPLWLEALSGLLLVTVIIAVMGPWAGKPKELIAATS